jgi:hypothetical protein
VRVLLVIKEYPMEMPIIYIQDIAKEQ